MLVTYIMNNNELKERRACVCVCVCVWVCGCVCVWDRKREREKREVGRRYMTMILWEYKQAFALKSFQKALYSIFYIIFAIVPYVYSHEKRYVF